MEKYFSLFDSNKAYKNGINTAKKTNLQDIRNNNHDEKRDYFKFMSIDQIKNNTHTQNGLPYLYFSKVRLLSDSKVVKISNGVFLTDIIEIVKIKHISKLKLWNNYNFCFHMAKFPGSLLYIKQKSQEIYTISVENYGENLKYIKPEDQTEELCMKAVNNNGNALEYVLNKTNEIIYAAIETKPEAIRFVPNPSHEMCLRVVRKHGYCLSLIKNQDEQSSDYEEICIEAIKQWPAAIRYVTNKTPLIVETAIKEDGFNICFVDELSITHNLILIAAKTYEAIFLNKSVKKLLNQNLCLEIIKINYKCFKYIEKQYQTPEICIKVIQQNGFYYMYIKSEAIKKELQLYDTAQNNILDRYNEYDNFIRKYKRFMMISKNIYDSPLDQARFIFSEFTIEQIKIILSQFKEIYNLIFDFFEELDFEIVQPFLSHNGIIYNSEENYKISLIYDLPEKHHHFLVALSLNLSNDIFKLLNMIRFFNPDMYKFYGIEYLDINSKNEVIFVDPDIETLSDRQLYIINGIECCLHKKEMYKWIGYDEINANDLGLFD